MSIILLIVGLLLFVSLVVVHEWGHFIMARRGGVGVEEFSIFFPPRLYSKKTKGGWNFSVGALPLGGFVKLKGEHDTDTEPGSYGAADLWTKTKIMAAGVFMNFVVAFLLLTIVAALGMPQLVDNQFTVKNDTKILKSQLLVAQVEKGSPADKAGLVSTDRLLSMSSGAKTIQLDADTKLPGITEQFAGQKVRVVYAHAGTQKSTDVTMRSKAEIAASKKTDNPKGYFGIVPTTLVLQRSTWSSPVVALGLMKQFTVLTFQGLGKALAGVGSILAGSATGNTEARQNGQAEASSQVSGPVGIFVILKDGSLLGYQFMLLIIAIISLTLAIMNLLPIPALDGGRLWITLAARAIKKPLTPRREELVNAIGFFVLIGIIILVSVVDVKRFF